MLDKKTKGPQFLRYVPPVIETLKELGASGTSSEVIDRVLERCGISEAEQAETTSNGQSRIRNQIGWARFYLTKAGLLDSSQRGVWTLTEAGRRAKLDPEAVHALFKSVQKAFARKPRETDEIPNAEKEETAAPEAGESDHRSELLQMLQSLPASGFERVCQRLLRESGFQQVLVTGRSGDGGIDGHGILEVNPLVTFKVLFQCKKYTDRTVTPSQVRDFRGAMLGRADKGLIITTGTFSVEAKKEATRDGVPPIELVNGDKLVAMFERAELGLRPVQTYVVDDQFFDEFRRQ